MNKRFGMLCGMLVLWATSLLAQEPAPEASATITTTTSREEWYVQPWVWVVGGAVLLLLLIALLRGSRSGKSDRVTYTKTVERD